MLFQYSGVSSRKPRLAPKPAFAKETSIWPNRSKAVCAIACWSSHSVTSQRTASVRSGPPSSSARSRSFSSRRAASTSRYPASAAAARGRLADAARGTCNYEDRVAHILPRGEAKLRHHTPRGGVLGGGDADDSLEAEIVERISNARRARFGREPPALPGHIDQPAHLGIVRPFAVIRQANSPDERFGLFLFGRPQAEAMGLPVPLDVRKHHLGLLTRKRGLTHVLHEDRIGVPTDEGVEVLWTPAAQAEPRRLELIAHGYSEETSARANSGASNGWRSSSVSPTPTSLTGSPSSCAKGGIA